MTITKNAVARKIGVDMTTLTRTVVVTNKAQCAKCGDILESVHRHDFKFCSCGSISVDGGKDYVKRSFRDYGDIIELSETYEEQYEAQW